MAEFMPRLVIKDVELLRILTKMFGFLVLRQKGSHVRLSNGVRRVTIPIHNRELRQGTLIPYWFRQVLQGRTY